MTGLMGDQKKARFENAPSKVIHVRNVPADAVDTELLALGLTFGRVKNVLLLKSKKPHEPTQGFIEMEDKETASTFLNYYSHVTPTIRGQVVYVQYSNHPELKTEPSQHSSGTSKIIAAGGDFNTPYSADGQQAAVAAAVAKGVGKSNVIRAVIDKLWYPITVEVLYKIFSSLGTILRIVTFTKSGQFQALIEFSSSSEAELAKLTLDGQNIYNGCCTLHLEYSKLTTLTVKYNNDKSKDYTRPDLPSGPNENPFGGADIASLAALAGGAGGGASLMGAPALLSLLPQGGLLQANFLAATGARGGMGLGTPVVLVSNLNEERINCDMLFTLFGVYGDVVRVKILFNKKDTALIQFNYVQQAQTAITHLSGVKVYGKEIKVTSSKHNSVSMPKEGDENNLTKDFTHSPLHRFKKPGSKNFQNIFPPNRTLHVSNIPESTTEEELIDAFSAAGTVTEFRFFPKDRKMALVTLTSTEEAIDALVKMHNYKITESNHLRVSFAKTRTS
ncbi:polypyrimidine tract-binding protein 1-like [Orbicella faveolata]|uniref:polypyrimidine tract-binding protein 1-like n=1 Tax=Orbicella faveolata TaxID=48498 RepID=UPI0009E53DF3|nr:polypyrimidine tract-binding protein 1-like [Orbicella faveolata]